jgi:high-affinity Fe2+/Pb2+ permease
MERAKKSRVWQFISSTILLFALAGLVWGSGRRMHDWLEAAVASSGLCLVVSYFYWMIERRENPKRSN